MDSLQHVQKAMLSHKVTTVLTKCFPTTRENSEEHDFSLVMYGKIRRPEFPRVLARQNAYENRNFWLKRSNWKDPQVQNMLELNDIEPLTMRREYAMVYPTKKDGKNRLCV